MSGSPDVAVIGAGPAGLMAAETAARAGARVAVYDHKPTPARKLLIAGRGGLNLTHSEPEEPFLNRYGPERARLEGYIRAFSPSDLVAWCEGLGQETFVGVSGRVFPKAMKASPLLRAWLARLEGLGVALHMRRRWTGWEGGALAFDLGEPIRPRAAVLALGGASWPHLGSDGGWAEILRARGVEAAPFEAANCGFMADWSPLMKERFAGAPLKRVALSIGAARAMGEGVITAAGVEGGVFYALGREIRAALRHGPARVSLDLRPDLTLEEITRRLSAPRGKRSLATHLDKAIRLAPAALALMREAGPLPPEPAALAARVKAAPLTLTGDAGLARAISSAGGLRWSAINPDLSLKALPGVFVAGEMIDWEAPTGGYLLQASFATGAAAGRGAAAHAALDSRA